MAAQAQRRVTDQQRQQQGQHHRHAEGRPRRGGDHGIAVGVLARHQEPHGLQPAHHGRVMPSRKIVRRQHRRGIAARGKERAVAHGNLAGVAHEQAQPDHHRTIVHRHGKLRETVLGARQVQGRLRRDHRRGKTQDSQPPQARPKRVIRFPGAARGGAGAPRRSGGMDRASGERRCGYGLHAGVLDGRYGRGLNAPSLAPPRGRQTIRAGGQRAPPAGSRKPSRRCRPPATG